MKSFSVRQPRLLVLCASVAVSFVLFSGITSTFQQAGDSALCMARMAQFEQTQAAAQAAASGATQTGHTASSDVADARLAADGVKNSAKL